MRTFFWSAAKGDPLQIKEAPNPERNNLMDWSFLNRYVKVKPIISFIYEDLGGSNRMCVSRRERICKQTLWQTTVCFAR